MTSSPRWRQSSKKFSWTAPAMLFGSARSQGDTWIPALIIFLPFFLKGEDPWKVRGAFWRFYLIVDLPKSTMAQTRFSTISHYFRVTLSSLSSLPSLSSLSFVFVLRLFGEALPSRWLVFYIAACSTSNKIVCLHLCCMHPPPTLPFSFCKEIYGAAIFTQMSNIRYDLGKGL